MGHENVIELPTFMGSEDFSRYGLPGRHHYGGEPVQYCFWFFGGHSRELYNAAPGDTQAITLAVKSSVQLCA